MTAFCSARVEVADGVYLTVDGNSKITAGNGTFTKPKPNAFSLPSPDTCVGATTACRKACYTRGLRANAPELAQAYCENLAVVRNTLALPAANRNAAVARFANWIEAHCLGGFRWHVSGDFFSREYAAWVADVCWASRHVRHWVYTRALCYVDELVGVPNLVVNVSADLDNYTRARRTADHSGCRLCYFARAGEAIPTDLRPGDVIFPDYPLRLRLGGETPEAAAWWNALSLADKRRVCPADMWGQSETRRCTVPGAYAGCTRCTTAELET